ncbi:hypothetical protein [Mycobacteroides abscessus]|uniref:hypothetical protein n=1 Tax=Mycobacteroides abscessus TaxID=36809 RepID=UPI000C2591A1|nr:hypothetical protein [Mycobacteroides abscessus]
MFDEWVNPPGFKTLYLMDMPVTVESSRAWPGQFMHLGVSLPSREVRTYGLKVEPFMRGRLVAQVRRTDGDWFAVVEVPAASGDGQSRLTMQLWLPPEVVRPD